jgi:hypothetical protein
MDYFGKRTGRLGPHDWLALSTVGLILMLVLLFFSFLH